MENNLSRKISALTYVVLLVLTVSLRFLRDHFAIMLSSEQFLPIHALLSAVAAMLAVLTFAVGWQTYSTGRSWPITLLASIFLGVSQLEMTYMISYPGMAPWITDNTAQKALLFGYGSRFLIGGALLIAARTARFETMSHLTHRRVLAMTLGGVVAVYPLFLLAPNAFPSFLPGTASAYFVHGLLMLMYAASGLQFIRLRATGITWSSKLLQACALMLLAEMNFSLAASDFDYGNLFANVLLIAALAMVYLGVFQHSIGIPIDAMNKWKAQLKTSQRELNITKLAVDGSDHYIFMYDDATTLLYVSDNACKRLGYKVDELVGKSSAQLSAVASRKMREPDWTSLFEQGHMSYEGTLRTRSGDIIPVDVAITKIVEDDELRYCAIIHDITERKLYEQQRERAADYLRRIIDGIPHFVTVLDAQGNVIDLNEAFAGLYPFDPKTMRGMHYRELIGPFLLDDESRQLMEETLAKALQGISAKCDVYVGGADIHEYIECAFESLVNSEGQIENIIVTGVYITERVRSQIQLKLAATVFDHSAEAILITDGDIRILSVNKAFTIITGFIEEEAINTVPPLFERGKHLEPMRLALLTSGNWSGEVEWLSKSGQLCFEWVTVTEVTGGDGKISNYIVIFSDITEKKRAEEHIQYLAYYDPLTNLPNRVLLEDRIQQAIATAKREDHKVAIIFLDLDHFKTINDSLGHQHGDKILSEVAKRLKRNIREYDTVARLGGDEFIIVLSHLHDSEEAAAISRKLLEELALPYFSGDNELRLTVSIGVSIYPDDGDDFSRLIMNADAAMYHAKESGRNNAQFFIGEMNRRAAELLTVENHLRRAIERNEFILHFQPQIDLRTSAIIGFEALVRWQDPVRGLIPPAQFIPVAEERGLIADIGNWVLREACRQNRAWQDAGLPLIPVAVNISAKQFRNKDFVDNVRRVLLETGLEARYLELEVTETTVMQDAESLISTLEELQQLGVHLAVDDFGTGYSSLSYLKRFPIDKIKIDRSFIRDIPGDKDDHSIVRAIIGLTQQLNLKVIAEGVETIEQLTALRESQCDQYQGFYFSKPVPANDAEQLLRSNRPIG